MSEQVLKNSHRMENTLKNIFRIIFAAFLIALTPGVIYHFTNPGNVFTYEGGTIPWNKSDRRFALKVLPQSQNSLDYQIVFTTNGFLTTTNIEEYLTSYNEYQLWLDSKEESVKLAHQLNTLEKCLDHNKKVESMVVKDNQIIVITGR